ncbi:hypothetical protein BC830DRAFT_148145 [Chytriomyces sp. MP71]|nr:hypothetical protein BC830DRAFT_148145 [Chytriomyces sp. MP71]
METRSAMEIFTCINCIDTKGGDSFPHSSPPFSCIFEQAIKTKETTRPYLLDSATTELKRLGEEKVELIGQKDRLAAVMEAKQGSSTSSDSSLSVKEPHTVCKRRWHELNRILSSNKKKLKTTDSVGYSYVTWAQVKEIFKTTSYGKQLKTYLNIP